MEKVQLVNNVDSTNTNYLRSHLAQIRANYNDKRIIIDNLHLYSMGRNYADIETILNAVKNFNSMVMLVIIGGNKDLKY